MPIDIGRLEVLEQQSADTAAAITELSRSLSLKREARIPIAARLDRASEAHRIITASEFEETSDRTQQLSAEISALVDELNCIDSEIAQLEEQRNAQRETAAELSSLVAACRKYLEMSHD